VSRLPAALGVTIALALVGGPVAMTAGQVRCARGGDHLTCEDGRTYFIYPDDEGGRGARPGLGLGAPGRDAWAPGGRRDLDPGAWPTGGPWLESTDGLVCYPHGSHVHCR
jgi:hypothetical protein